MARASGRDSDESSPLIRDAVHGLIDISDTIISDSPIIARLIHSRPLQRLRRVKQLGFASQSYVAADHSRYAHSIGTMHVMRKLLNQVHTARYSFLEDLTRQYRECYESDDPFDWDLLHEHVLVAALLQDLGELPYQNATKGLFLPDDDLRAWVGSKIEEDVSLWPAKPVFSLACLFGSEIQEILLNLNVHFIAFLMTADYWSEPEWSSRFRPLRHMLDGEIDADRIDYVHRDAHHTVGMLGTSDDVISSIISYDDLGPICSDPAPLGNFLATRAHLYSIVYFAPQNRFRVLLMRSIIRGIRELPAVAATVPVLGSKYIGVDSFLELDDVRLEAEIDNLNVGRAKARLDKRTSIALAEFTSASSAYSHFWLRESQQGPSDEGAIVPVPKDVFFEIFDAGSPAQSGVRFEVSTPTGTVDLARIEPPRDRWRL